MLVTDADQFNFRVEGIPKAIKSEEMRVDWL